MRAAACAVTVVACLGLGCRTPRAPESAPRVGHVVIFWLKQPGDEVARQRVIDASRSFRSISGVFGVEAGAVLPSPRPNVDKSYDVAVVMWFRDRDALEAYQGHPRHQAMLREVGTLVERTVVYDFTRSGSK